MFSELHDVETICTEIHPNRSRDMESTDINFFASLIKTVAVPIFTKFVIRRELSCKELVYRIS